MENSNTKKDHRKENNGEEIGVDKDVQVQGGAAAAFSLDELPEGCIAKILSATSPVDACRLSCLSTTFKSAASSDSVWGSFLPSDYQTILSGSWPDDADSSPLAFSSKKELFFYLSHNPILIDQGKKSFSMDKRSGKKSYMIAARDLGIAWADTPEYWDWVSLPESRFKEVAKLKYVRWFEIHGKISTSKLSLDTNYAAYLVFKLQEEEEPYGFAYDPAEVSLTLGADKICTKYVILDPFSERRILERCIRCCRLPIRRTSIKTSHMFRVEKAKERVDGWLEIELGEFFNRDGGDEVDMSVMEVKSGFVKRGLVVEGIEIRPKEENAEILLSPLDFMRSIRSC